jgi:DNA-binding transcriptional regulator GbsR (MarR family)
MSVVMTNDQAAFVEAMAQHLYGRGMRRLNARLWSWLLICEPPEQTAAELADALDVSRGAISGAVNDLAAARLIQRRTRRGERREEFSIPAGTVQRLISQMATVLRQGREIADEGLELLGDRPPPVRARLAELRDVYAYYETEWPTAVERYLKDRASDRTSLSA